MTWASQEKLISGMDWSENSQNGSWLGEEPCSTIHSPNFRWPQMSVCQRGTNEESGGVVEKCGKVVVERVACRVLGFGFQQDRPAPPLFIVPERRQSVKTSTRCVGVRTCNFIRSMRLVPPARKAAPFSAETALTASSAFSARASRKGFI